MKRIIFTLIILLSGLALYGSQPESKVNVVYDVGVYRQGVDLRVDIEMDLSELKLKSKEMVVVTPVVVSHSTDEQVEIEPIIIAGPRRYRFMQRAVFFDEADELEQAPAEIVKFNKKSAKQYTYSTTVAYEPWMRNATLLVNEAVGACHLQDEGTSTAPFAPANDYIITYVVPPVDDIKARSHEASVHLSYPVGKANLSRYYGDNASVLDEVDRLVGAFVDDHNITITKFFVKGYSSPDGNYDYNMKLSKDRATSFLNYLTGRFGDAAKQVRAEGYGEDWEGLYLAVLNSDVQDKDKILNIISNTENIAQRKQALKMLSGGKTYQILLNEFYPMLRRDVIEVRYNVRKFDLEEARDMLFIKPQLLSRNEMYLIAKNYPRDSEEFKKVFDIAVRMFPDDWYAIMNNAAYEIESGALDRAIKTLEEDDSAVAYNNLGVAYAYKGDIKMAEIYFNRAAKKGSQDAKQNLKILHPDGKQ